MKKILWILFSVAWIALLYYFLIKPFEFEVNFKTNTMPGDVIQTIQIWNRSLEDARVIEVDSFSRLKQTITWKERRYSYNWHFIIVNDSITKVNVRISELGRNFYNKLLVPFSAPPIEQDARNIMNAFYDILKVHLKITNVKITGETELDSLFCICRSLETTQIEKAQGMMKEYSLITSVINDFNLKVDGTPLVKIRRWNHTLGLLRFDFCFPIFYTDSLPLVGGITYRQFKKEKVLRAEYHGNYITSDRAWYELLHYAEREGYTTNFLPIEYFYNNPNLGMNESEWRADVYLPIMD
jgi:hypothetical protein